MIILHDLLLEQVWALPPCQIRNNPMLAFSQSSHLSTELTDSFVLPHEVLLREAQWLRQGDHLLIKWWSETITIEHYFNNPIPLSINNGKILDVSEIMAQLTPQLPHHWAAEGQLTIGAAMPVIGTATLVVNGPVTVENDRGQIRQVAQGDPIYLNDKVQTPAKGYIKITLNDGSTFQLGPLSRAQLEKYSYVAEEQGGELEVNMFIGFFRFISGKISGDSGEQHTIIKTPSATIGIRGSEIDALIENNGATTILHTEGLISVTPLFSHETFTVFQPGTRIYIDNVTLLRAMASVQEMEQFKAQLAPLKTYQDSLSPLILQPETSAGQARSSDMRTGIEAMPPRSSDNNRADQPATPPPQAGEFKPIKDGFLSFDGRPFDPLGHLPPRPFDAPNVFHNKLIPQKIEYFIPSKPLASVPLLDPQPGFFKPHFLDKPHLFNNEHSKNLPPLHHGIVPPLPSPVLPIPPEAEDNNDDTVSPTPPIPPQDALPIPEVPEPPITPPTVPVVPPEPTQPPVIAPEPPTPPEPPPTPPVIPTPPEPLPIPDPIPPPLPVNNAPIAHADHVDLGTNRSLVIDNLLQNDVDIDGDNLRILSVQNGENGQVILLDNNTVVFTRDLVNNTESFTGSFSYTITDDKGSFAEANVTVIGDPIITPLPSLPPVAAPDQFMMVKNTALSLESSQLLANDSDPQNLPLTLISVIQGEGGRVSLQGQQIEFIAENNFIGSVFFSYQIQNSAGQSTQSTVTVNIVNQAPQAQNDFFSTEQNQPLTLSIQELLANDQDLDGDLFTLTNIFPATDGNAILSEDNNQIIFTPNPDFLGEARFDYQIADLHNSTATATVIITVEPLVQNIEAIDDNFTAFVNDEFVLSAKELLGNDQFSNSELQNSALIQSVNNPVNGRVILDAETQAIRFIPETDFIGNASFIYEVIADSLTATATVTINYLGALPEPVTAVNDSGFFTKMGQALTIDPNRLLANDNNPNNMPLSITQLSMAQHGQVQFNLNGQIEFLPEANYIGIARFNYEITDGQTNSTATVFIDVLNANQAPVANPDQFEISFLQSISLDVMDLLANDADPDSTDIIRFMGVSNIPEGLTIEVSGNDLHLWADYRALAATDSVSFNYLISDGEIESEGTVELRPSNVFLGTEGADTFTPNLSSDVQIFKGLGGNDSFGIPGPNDILLGDAGEDLFLLKVDAATGVIIEGGADLDTLRLSGGEGQVLNLIQNSQLTADQAITLTGIDRLDLTQGSGHQFVLGLSDVLAISDAASLRIDGNLSSLVNSTNQGWNYLGLTEQDGMPYYRYADSGAELLISTDIALQFIS
jgi:hypothetical protein